MRTETTTRTLYKFEELSDQAKEQEAITINEYEFTEAGKIA